MPTVDHFKKSRNFVDYSAGAIIFNEGDRGNIMYAVREGEIELITHDEVIEVVGPGGIFGEMGLLENEPRTATARAKTDCRIVPVDEYHFFYLIDEAPMFAITVMRILADRLRKSLELRFSRETQAE